MNYSNDNSKSGSIYDDLNYNKLVDRFIELIKIEGARINPVFAETTAEKSDMLDLYGLHEPYGCVGTVRYARNPRGPWVAYADIPHEITDQLKNRNDMDFDDWCGDREFTIKTNDKIYSELECVCEQIRQFRLNWRSGESGLN